MDHATPPRFRMTTTFGDAGPGKTRLTMRGVFESREVRDRVVREVKADRGLVDNLEKLGERLAAMSAATEARVRSSTRMTRHVVRSRVIPVS